MGGEAKPTGPDLEQGVPWSHVPDGGSLAGQVKGEAVLLVRRGEEAWAVGATCTHYGGPLAEGILVGHELRCPWHHACFDVRNGAALGPPALNPLPCWRVERDGARVRVAGKLEAKPRPAAAGGPESVVIVGAGAAGAVAAETLRREGYAGSVTLVSREAPVDRPNLSKDYLAGTAPEDWIPLRGDEFYAEQRIERVSATVTRIDLTGRRVELGDGASLPFGALLLATGAAPIRLSIPGADLPQVFTLRTLADSRAIIARAGGARRAVVVGTSFIGLEAAAALRARELEVHVVGPDVRPLERVLGPELGDFVRKLHESHGVRFHLGRKPAAISERQVTLDDGSRLDADLVVMGVGVRPETALAEGAGIRSERGVLVDEYLETSASGVFAAGDVARFPWRGASVRIEHWVVAERQGMCAARNLLGRREPFRAVPFFWSQHYDVSIRYVGHAESWDRIEIAGSVEARDCLVGYRSAGRVQALASIERDRDSLWAEDALARDDQAALDALLHARP